MKNTLGSISIAAKGALILLALSFATSSMSLDATAKSKDKDEDGRRGNWKSSLQGSPSLEKCKARVEKNPKDADAQNDYGWALRQLGKYPEAEAALRTSISLNPNLSYSHSNLSVTLLDQDKKEESLAEAKKAIELDNKQPIYRVVLGNAQAANGDRKSAVDSYKMAITFQPDYENAYYNMGKVLDEDGQATEAKVALSQALNLDPNDDRVIRLLDKLMK